MDEICRSAVLMYCKQVIYYFLCFRYTGHCPTLKFRFGKPYGANTKDIIKVLVEGFILISLCKAPI